MDIAAVIVAGFLHHSSRQSSQIVAGVVASPAEHPVLIVFGLGDTVLFQRYVAPVDPAPCAIAKALAVAHSSPPHFGALFVPPGITAGVAVWFTTGGRDCGGTAGDRDGGGTAGDDQSSNSRFHDFMFLFLFIINIEKSRPFIVRDFS